MSKRDVPSFVTVLIIWISESSRRLVLDTPNPFSESERHEVKGVNVLSHLSSRGFRDAKMEETGVLRKWGGLGKF